MAIQEGIYRLYGRYKIGVNGSWDYIEKNLLTYVKVSETRELSTQQYQLISNNTPNTANIDFINDIIKLNKIPIIYKNLILCGSANEWNYYDNNRTGLINLIGDNIQQSLSLPNTYSVPSSIVSSSNKIYCEYAFDEDFTNILCAGSYYATATSDFPIFRISNSENSTSSPLSVKHMFFEYVISENKLYPIEISYSYTYRGVSSPYNGAYANSGLINIPNQSHWISAFENAEVYEPTTDPYVNGGGSSGGGGGTGDFDGTSDTIGLPSLPSLSGLNTGFFTAFVPSASQMQSVSNYLWNNALTDILDPDTGLGEKIDALKKIVANPYDAIMGCSIIPVTPPTAGSKELKMYGILETGISLPYASTRWVKVDCGTLNIHEFWGSYLDYSPYTKTTSLYLPYIGTVSIDIDLIMAKSLQVVYYVDILSGICVAFILVDGSVKFHYQGQCSTQVPITNADYSSVISAGIGLIGNASQVVGSAVTGGAGGGIGGAVAGAVSGAISQAPAVASNVMSAKPDIRSGGAIGSSAGILSVQRPYLIIERPKQSVPAFQNHFTGYPSNITAKVSDLTGYTEFESINLDGIALTDAEKAELDNILKGGVYL